MHRDELTAILNAQLRPELLRDVCPNGLQVEGRAQVGRIVSGVTASVALIEEAVAAQADALLVHHGYFWRGEDARIVGTRKARLQRLLAHDLNLYAYHLPLDVHPTLGNNAQLARVLGLARDGSFGEQDLGAIGRDASGAAVAVGALRDRIEAALRRTPLLVGAADRKVRRIAWCTGAAQSLLEAAIAAGAELFVTGEVSEQTVHLAREADVAFIAAGHHATERYGVQALGEWLAREGGLEHRFIDIDNPA